MVSCGDEGHVWSHILSTRTSHVTHQAWWSVSVPAMGMLQCTSLCTTFRDVSGCISEGRG